MAIPSGRNFANCYAELCKQQRLRPLPVISVTLPHSLDFTTDRVKMDDWGPILNSLSLDRSLKSISVRSRYQSRKPLEEINSEDKARAMGKAPVVLTRYLLECLSHSVAQCVRNSNNLTYLELEGIPFPPDCLAVLCVGLASTETLQHLSLQRCYIGDTGCDLICRTIADVHSITSLNLSQCDLTTNSGSPLAAALSRQKLSLYQDTWKQSLRYREPNLDAMPGLRRLSLNHNSHLSDAAVLELIDAIRDSLWLKALDIQHCGITDRIGKDLLELLDYNSTLVVLDVRLNDNLNNEVVKEVIKRLEENDAAGKSEYRWLSLPQKDHRAVPTTVQKTNEFVNAKKVPSRSRSAANVYMQKPCQPIAPRKRVPASNASKRTKIRPPLPSPENYGRPQQDRSAGDSLVRTRPSLHLNLQAEIQSVVDQMENSVEEGRDTGHLTVDAETPTKVKTGSNESQAEMESKVQKILMELAEARTQHSRLLEETKRTDLLLAEERARCEVAEANLCSMRDELIELEDTLKSKEPRTMSYFLVSQQSLDEISTTFDRLLDMLECMTGSPAASKNGESTEIARARADMRLRVASVIRKTKSESLRRGYVVNVRGVETPRHVMDPSKKFARSESDIRNNLSHLSPMRIERKIGDTPDVRSTPMDGQMVGGRRSEKLPASPSARARAIFARIVNGDALIDFASQVD